MDELRTPDITVSIVSYNTVDLLRDCVASLLKRQAEGEAVLEIVVADNGSTDGSKEMLASEFPEVIIVDTGGNIGYGRANNAALKAARGQFYFVLNSDTEVEPGALRAMIHFMEKNPRVGMLGAQLILPDQSIQRSCARDPTLMAILWEQTYLDKIFPDSKYCGSYKYSGWDYRSAREVQQVCGACFFIRERAWRQIGGFDPAYFMYFEDTDLCVRMRRKGWPIFFLPDARIQHKLGGSSGKSWRLRALMIASYNQSRYYYYRSNYGPKKGRLVKLMTLFGASLRLTIWLFTSIVRPSAWEQVRMFADVWRRTLTMTDITPAHADV
jgi:N-acetylglucosaminyl-diphospho-decaprenol L-rhamnosyltransferase